MAHCGYGTIELCRLAEPLEGFKPSQLPIRSKKKARSCVSALKSGLLAYDPETRRYMVKSNWRMILILRNNPLVSKRPPEPAPEPDDDDKPLLTREQKRKLAQSTVQSAMSSRTALEMAWR